MIHVKCLSAILRYISKNGYQHREGIAIIVSDIFEENPQCSLEEFTEEISKIHHDFFRINKIDRNAFAADLYQPLRRAHRGIRSQGIRTPPTTDKEEVMVSSAQPRRSRLRNGTHGLIRSFSVELLVGFYIGTVIWIASQLGMLEIIPLFLLVGLPGVICLLYSQRRHRQ